MKEKTRVISQDATRKTGAAPKKKPTSIKNKTGRPSEYRDEYSEQTYKLCLLGATDKDLAAFFEVSEQTINSWKTKHPEFLESLKRGKQDADAKVASSLYHRAIGYSHPEDKIFNNAGVPMVVPTIKHYPPDTTAAIFWLKNRESAKWRDKHEVAVGSPGDERIALLKMGAERVRKAKLELQKRQQQQGV